MNIELIMKIIIINFSLNSHHLPRISNRVVVISQPFCSSYHVYFILLIMLYRQWIFLLQYFLYSQTWLFCWRVCHVLIFTWTRDWQQKLLSITCSFFPPFSSIHTLSIPLPISLVHYHVSLHFLLHSFFFTLITGVVLSALLNYIGYICLSLSYLPIFYLYDEALSLPLSLTTRWTELLPSAAFFCFIYSFICLCVFFSHILLYHDSFPSLLTPFFIIFP